MKLINDRDLKDDLFQYYSSVEKFVPNFEFYPQQRTYQAREITNAPFTKFDMNKFLKAVYTGRFDSVPQPDTFRELWQLRDEYLPLHHKIASISHMQHIDFLYIIDSGEILLK